jgi:ADP-ribosylglycohydrolase
VTTLPERYRGCLLGGAVGDALGAGIEFLSLAEIRRHGPGGVNGYVPACGGTGAITDDTQMTLFTAEGLHRDQQRSAGRRDAAAAIWRAYRRWLSAQYGEPAADCGWLSSQQFLREERAPGTTCLSALHAGHPGTVSRAVNDSKGCGGVMRVAPFGLAGDNPFALACQAAALTAADFGSGVLAAVNHGGDSDSTGAICGNLLGVSLGAGGDRRRPARRARRTRRLHPVADDLHAVFACGQTPDAGRSPSG